MVGLHERDQRVQRVLDRLAVRGPDLAWRRATRRRATAPARACRRRPSRRRPCSSRPCAAAAPTACGSTRGRSPPSPGRGCGFASSRRWKADRMYWSGIGGVAELRARVADVAAVVDLVVVVERRSLRPVLLVRRHVGDRPPARALERVAEGEAVARDELVVALLVVDPQPGLQGGVGQPADAAERRRGEEARCGRRTRPRAAAWSRRRARRRPAARTPSPGPRPARSSRRTRR